MSLSKRATNGSASTRDRGRVVRGITAAIGLLAISIWLGGMIALGAIVAPVVFAVAPFPSNADAMTIVFQRFDLVAMSGAAIVLGAEATRAAARVPFAASERFRAGMSAVAGALAVVEGTRVSPRIAALHGAGAVRGIGSAGQELARLHDLAEWCGTAQVVLLVVVVVLHVVALSGPPRERPSL